MALPRYKVYWTDPHHEFVSEFERRQYGGLPRFKQFDDRDEALAFAEKIRSQGIDRPQVYERGSPVPLSGPHRAPLASRRRDRSSHSRRARRDARPSTRRRDPARYLAVADKYDEEEGHWRNENEDWPVLKKFPVNAREAAEDYAEALNERRGWYGRFVVTGPWGGGRDPKRKRSRSSRVRSR